MSEPLIIQSAQGTVTAADVIRSLREVGINSGDTLFVHSRILAFGRPVGLRTKEEFANFFIEAILSVLGPEGTLIVPTFTLSFCRNGVFNSVTSESEVGLLSKVFRRRKDTIRTTNPIYSVAVAGKDKEYYLTAGTTNCTGKGSILDLIHRRGLVKILLLGLDNPVTTQFHYVEEQAGVPYRHRKTFTGLADGKAVAIDVYVRDRRCLPPPQIDLSKFPPFFEQNRLLKKTELGDGKVIVIEEPAMHRSLVKLFSEDPGYFLKEPYQPPIELREK
jgi:aminoglycoside 3-N-acetyltransferase